VSWEAAIAKSLSAGAWWDLSSFGVGKETAFRSQVQIDTGAKGSPALVLPTPVSVGTPMSEVSDTGELMWGRDQGIVTINTARSKAFIGKTTGETIKLGDVVIEPHKNRQNWAAVTITAMDGRDLKSPGRILITATGDAENTGMVWADAQEDRLAGGNWGKAPSLVEVVPARVSLSIAAGRVKAWALDERGQRAEEVPVGADGNNATIEIGPPARTLWYELDIAE
jgi:hypothetical protein